MSGVFEDLSEEECYLYALFQDYSGIDIAEFCLVDEEFEDGLVRAFPMQYAWWRNNDKHQIDAGSRSAGKALDVNTPILTTAGWKVMGSVVVGDFVFNETGNPVEVLEVFDTLYDRDCYEVSFSDGSTIVADGEHFWKTCTKRGEVNKVATTLEIKDTLTLWGEANHRIPVAMPLQYPDKELLVEPYGLGYWLGDGSSQSGYLHIGEHDVDAVTNLCSEIGLTLQKLAGGVSVYAIKLLEQGWTELPVLADEGILPPRGRLTNGQVKECRRLAMNGVSYDDLVAIYGVSKTSICEYVLGQQRREAGGPIRPPRRDLYASHLEEIGVLKNKHIPDRYMTASFRQRLALLQGIMDSDGHIRKNGSCEISLSNFRLAEDVYKLLLTLGQKPAIRTKQTRCNGNPSNPTRRITFTPINGVVPFRLPRKVERVKLSGSPRAAKRSIWDVRQVPSRPVRCIRVSGDSHLFLAGASLIPTHNSMSIRYRAVAFPFIHPGAEMLITAPESVHLQAITSKIENIYLNNRIPREMLASRGNTPRIQQRPTWNMTFMNGGSIKGRIPQRDGKGVKGMHPTWLEQDESSDYPEAGWVELSSTLAKVDGATWRCVGEGQKVLTSEGWVNIEDVSVGDEVWTHKNRWRKVLNVWDTGAQECVRVKGQGHPGIVATPEHKFWLKSLRSEPSWVPIGTDPDSRLWAICAEPGVYWERIDDVSPAGKYQTYDLEVEEDHSYVLEGIICSNSHGVTRGVGGTFDKYCSPGSGWTVHRLPAMLRPTWDDEERAEAVMKYGSEENIDFRRNILGLPGDSTAALFVLSRLVRCFFEKTPVWTVNDDGVLDQVCISDVNVGDSVLNGSKSGTGVVLGKIPSEHSSILELVVDGEVFYVTEEHPMFTTRGWVRAGDLRVEDEILSREDVQKLWGGDFGEGEQACLFKELLVCLQQESSEEM